MADRKVMAERNFESLRVWQNARIFVNAVYDMMADNKDWGFRGQIQRASVSMMMQKVTNLDPMLNMQIS